MLQPHDDVDGDPREEDDEVEREDEPHRPRSWRGRYAAASIASTSSSFDMSARPFTSSSFARS
jgi:hypothetical protein